MKRTIFMVLLVALMIAMPVFANGSSETVSQNKGPVNVEVWSSLSGSKAKLFDAQVAKYNESQSDVVVNVIHQGGYNILRQKTAAAANAKTMPTILICDYLDVAYYAQLGLVKDMSQVLPSAIIDDFYPAMLDDLKYEGKLYAVPYNRSTQGFFVNNDALRQAGIDKAPSTWDEFKADCVKFKELGSDYYFGYAFFHQFLFDAISYTFGAQVATPDGDVRLTDPEMVEMFKYFQDLYAQGLLLMQPVLVGGFEEQNGAFLDGKVATVFQTSSFMPTAEKLLKCDWSFEFMPEGKGGRAVTIGGGNFAVTSQADKAQTEAAGKFLSYMASDAIVSEFFMNTGNLPVKRSVMNNADVKAFIENNKSYAKVIAQLEYGRPAPSTTKNIRDVFNRVNDMISRIILKGEDAETVLAEYDTLFQGEFDEAKANGEFIY